MNLQVTPTVLIAYPQAFACYEKFERKVSNILSNLPHFHIAYETDDNNLISRHLSQDARVHDAITSPLDDEHLGNITHAIIFNDGETFDHLIEKTKKIGIKSRIINTAITKVVNIDKDKKYDVYIGRGSTWGNPYAIGFNGDDEGSRDDREKVIRKFKYDFDRGFLRFKKEEVISLKGKVLGCHCKPAACHGDVIAAYLNSLDDGR